MKTEEFLASIVLTPSDARKYKRILNKVEKDLNNFNVNYNAFYGKVLSSDRYSHDVKLKSIFSLYSIEQSRLWGFKNLTGEGLFLFTQKVIQYTSDYLSEESLNVLTLNPAFSSSVGGDFNVPKIVFESFVTEHPKKEAMLTQLATSQSMNLEIAGLVVNFNATLDPTMLRGTRTLDEGLVIEWTRKAYDMEDVPDSWVQRFLMDAA